MSAVIDAWVDRLLDQEKALDADCWQVAAIHEVSIFTQYGDGYSGNVTGGGAGDGDHGWRYAMLRYSPADYGYPGRRSDNASVNTIQGMWGHQ